MHNKTIILLSISILSIIYTACTNSSGSVNEDELRKQNQGNSVIEVRTQKVHLQDFNRQLLANGKLYAAKHADLHFKTTESILKINYKNGDKVSKGSLIAMQDNAILKNRVQQAQIAYEKAKLDRVTRIIEYGLDPKNLDNTDTVLLHVIDVQSGYDAAYASLKNAKTELEYSYLRAPFSGVIAGIEIKEHQNANPGQPFCSVLDSQTFEAYFSILENELPLVKINQSVELKLFGDTMVYKANISEINPVIDKNGMVQIKAAVKNKNNNFYDGMNVQVSVNKQTRNSIVVPKQAVVMRSGRTVVFTFEGSLAKWKYVEITDENASEYLIGSGLNDGDEIIITNNLNLAHDSNVKKNE